jgi:hypothetical protein
MTQFLEIAVHSSQLTPWAYASTWGGMPPKHRRLFRSKGLISTHATFPRAHTSSRVFLITLLDATLELLEPAIRSRSGFGPLQAMWSAHYWRIPSPVNQSWMRREGSQGRKASGNFCIGDWGSIMVLLSEH